MASPTPPSRPESHSAGSDPAGNDPADNDPADDQVLTPEQEAVLLLESNASKTAANALFAAGDHRAAFNKYHEAFISCPKTRLFESAVLHSNIAACQLQFHDWADAIKSASAALADLDRLESRPAEAPAASDSADTHAPDDDVDEEIISAGAAAAQPPPPPPLSAAKADIRRIRCKALMRRARARSEAGGWQNLVGAEEDYKLLAGIVAPAVSPAAPPTAPVAKGANTDAGSTDASKASSTAAPKPNFNAGVHTILSAGDKKIVRAQLAALPPRIKAAQEAEMAEMWGKLKSLGNGLLKPFGLSTENFQMVKDEQSGGYSMSFNQNPKK
ncbi:hypothetical protein BROUX41_001570 [Berkeleyomyces rouxiae]|uniref:uncharacterized protein n=1 Tax=Berkeleyomyces rouxiae TaxID=2035830 RepID=UPI003B7B5DE9